jgi:hypothetical protein
VLYHHGINLINSVSPWHRSTLKVVLGSLMAGLMTTQVLAFSNLTAVTSDPIAETIPASNLESTSAWIEADNSMGTGQTLADGIYLYGESPESDQIGQAYMVFESRADKMIGAFYMPHSEFDCFYGTRQGNELALTVVNSYDLNTHTFAVGIVHQYPVASTSDHPTDGEFALEGLHPIAEVSELDQQLLATCKQNYQEQIW